MQQCNLPVPYSRALIAELHNYIPESEMKGSAVYPDKIDYEELLERAENSFRDVYLTLISIIQGVAFGFLGERAFDDPRSASARNE